VGWHSRLITAIFTLVPGRGRRVFIVDTETNLPIASFEVGTRPWGIGLSPDGKRLFMLMAHPMMFQLLTLQRRV
jgi:DNA-binding beta-propeller fold protein YncE